MRERLKEGPDTLEIGEVNVTSIKQSRSLLRQPVTVTTLKQGEIERLNIAGMKGVSEIAPNFFMPDYGSRMTSTIYVRGIGARIDQPAVGLNVDNIPYLNKNAYDFDSQDIERVEVLRGPQSTLFGRNTIAGLINIYTLSPFYYQGLRAIAEGATHGNYRLGLSYYRMLTPKLGMSLSGHRSYRRGYFRNSFNDSKADREHTESLRWKTVFKPTNSLSIENVASYGYAHQNGYPYAFEESGEINYNDPAFYRRKSFSEGLTVTYGNEAFSMASITGFQYLDDNMTLDQDFLPDSYFTLTQKQHDRSFTQDIVVRGKKGSYNWLGGAFGFYKYAGMTAPVTFKEDGIERLILAGVNSKLPPGMRLDWDSPELLLGSDFKQAAKGIAFYHQSSYDLDNLSFSFGLRFDYEHTSLKYHSHSSTSCTMWNVRNPAVPIPMKTVEISIDDRDKLSQHFTEILPKLSITYHLPHSAIFVSASKGYKAGGYNTQMFSTYLQQRLMSEVNPKGEETDVNANKMVSYRPEISWNYEIGGHFSVDHGRVYSTFALFLIDCRDQQLTVFPKGTTTGRIMTNAGRTRSMGGEFTMSYKPTSRWHFNLAYGYTNATFRRYVDGDESYRGKRVPYAPSNTLFLSASFRQPLSPSWINAVSITTDMRGTGSIYWDEANTYRQPFYTEFGAALRFEFPGATLDIWGKNLTDKEFATFRYESISNNFFQRGLPARGGITLRLDFPSL